MNVGTRMLDIATVSGLRLRTAAEAHRNDSAAADLANPSIRQTRSREFPAVAELTAIVIKVLAEIVKFSTRISNRLANKGDAR